MWKCGSCGCQNIAHDLAFCPQCFTGREEAEVPKITVAGGASDVAADREQEAQDAEDKRAERLSQRRAASSSAKQDAKSGPGTDVGSGSDSVKVTKSTSKSGKG